MNFTNTFSHLVSQKALKSALILSVGGVISALSISALAQESKAQASVAHSDSMPEQQQKMKPKAGL